MALVASEAPPTEEELPSLARDVVYELRMVLLAGGRLKALGMPEGNEYEWSAWVEVLLVHSRVLADFFGKPPAGDDLSADAYASSWDRNSDDIRWLRGHVPAINKRVMHLTAYRHRAREVVDAPDVGELVGRVTRTFVAFLAQLPPDRRKWFPIEIVEHSDEAEVGRGSDAGS